MSVQYYTVVCSLPRMNRYFHIQETPISRLQLEKRLKLLPTDKFTLAFTVESLAWTSWFAPHQSMSDLRGAFQNLIDTESVFIRDILIWFFDLRSIIAALRIRNETKEPPENPQEYWITRWNHKLFRNWGEPDFGLKSIYPWLPKVAADVAKKNTVAVEEFLLSYIWKYLSILETGHYFDFEAIIIYLLRWNIIHYWSQFNKDNALTYLNELSTLLLSKQLLHDVILNDKGSMS
ncbi:DUF2764 domain-containing protein [Fluoribacter gormanii]|uniref:DUF2764 family protein n=1 Tax=Fluoribacter gormanii TaxID=464 RepID=UPI001041176C|nr:DUF2764 family protein [Fluoribacter gormanii]MCW8445525.1 DUF2764 domain-containing protein [Fluoribacter gormanii]MCW8470775.1 DUF2764 domain-containing protein [Fluoribacter gormanii]